MPVVNGAPPARYRASHPDRAWLVVEVTDTSQRRTRNVMGPTCAASGFRGCWLVDLAVDRVEVCRDPGGDRYSRMETLRAGDVLTMARFRTSAWRSPSCSEGHLSRPCSRDTFLLILASKASKPSRAMIFLNWVRQFRAIETSSMMMSAARHAGWPPAALARKR